MCRFSVIVAIAVVSSNLAQGNVCTWTQPQGNSKLQWVLGKEEGVCTAYRLGGMSVPESYREPQVFKCTKPGSEELATDYQITIDGGSTTLKYVTEGDSPQSTESYSNGDKANGNHAVMVNSVTGYTTTQTAGGYPTGSDITEYHKGVIQSGGNTVPINRNRDGGTEVPHRGSTTSESTRPYAEENANEYPTNRDEVFHDYVGTESTHGVSSTKNVDTLHDKDNEKRVATGSVSGYATTHANKKYSTGSDTTGDHNSVTRSGRSTIPINGDGGAVEPHRGSATSTELDAEGNATGYPTNRDETTQGHAAMERTHSVFAENVDTIHDKDKDGEHDATGSVVGYGTTRTNEEDPTERGTMGYEIGTARGTITDDTTGVGGNTSESSSIHPAKGNTKLCSSPSHSHSQNCTFREDCYEISRRATNSTDGIYTVRPTGQTEPFKVYCCDMSFRGGGWTVIQRRVDRKTDFYRNWTSYREGFGSLKGDFWLGNEHLHHLTNQKKYTLRVDMVRAEGEKFNVTYSSFSVASESEYYRLTVEEESGMTFANGMNFSTHDNDTTRLNCTEKHKSAWWHASHTWSPRDNNFAGKICTGSNPNGDYNGKTLENIFWHPRENTFYRNLTYVEMKIRPYRN